LAAKGKAAKKTAHGKAGRQSTKVKSKAKGLHLSSAQWKAYTKAYNSVSSRMYAKATLVRAAKRFRSYRLQAAHGQQAQLRRINASTQKAAVAAYATKQSYRQSVSGHQNAALRRRVYNDMYKHYNDLGRFQFAQAGQKKWAHRAVMRTVDTSQAVSHEQKLRAAAARAALKAARQHKKPKPYKKGKYGPPLPKSVTSNIKATAQAAALKAAKATPAGTSSKANKVTKKSARGRGRPKGSTVANGAAKKGQGAQKKAQQKAQKAALTKASASAKAPVAAHKTRAAAAPFCGTRWLDSKEPACVAVAVSNQIRHQTGIELTIAQLDTIIAVTGNDVSIGVALSLLEQHFTEGNLRLTGFGPSDSRNGTIVGYDSRYGSHAALSLNKWSVASWGSRRFRLSVEESWWARWEVIADDIHEENNGKPGRS